MGKSSHLKVGFYLPNFSAWDIWKAFKMNFLDALNWVVGDISPLHSWGNFLPVIILMKKNASVLWLTSYFLPTSINPVVPPAFFSLPWQAALFVRICEDLYKFSCTQHIPESTLK